MFPFPLSFFIIDHFFFISPFTALSLNNSLCSPLLRLRNLITIVVSKLFTVSMSSSIGMCGIMVVWFSNVNLTTLKNLECLFFFFPWEVKGGGGAGELPRILWTMPKNLLVT